MSLTPSDRRISFKFQRKQFPLTVCFAMTINNSQRQSLSNVCLFLRQPVFTHDKLYVIFSRVKSKDILKMFFVECGMISIICLIISYFAISSISDVFNKALSNFMGKDINFLSFGISEFGYLVLIVFGIMLIANIIPIRKLTKMKPIDVINNK